MTQYADAALLVEAVIDHAPLRDLKRINAVFAQHSYPIWDVLTKEKRRKIKGGTKLKVFADSSFGGEDEIAEPDPEVTYGIDDRPKTMTYDWAGSKSSYYVGDQEAAAMRDEANARSKGNSKEARERRAEILAELLNWRRFGAMRKLPQGLCRRVWDPKDSADNIRRHLGIFDFACFAPSGTSAGTSGYLGYTRYLGDSGWSGSLAASTTVGGLDCSLSANAFFRNYNIVYDEAEFGGSKFFNKFEEMRTFMNFKPPANVDSSVWQPNPDWAIYVGTNLYIKLCEQQRMGDKAYGLTREGGVLRWMGIPIYDEPFLNNHPFMPIVWINWAHWEFNMRDGWFMKEVQGRDTERPTVEKVAVISEYQLICENRRYGCGVMHIPFTI